MDFSLLGLSRYVVVGAIEGPTTQHFRSIHDRARLADKNLVGLRNDRLPTMHARPKTKSHAACAGIHRGLNALPRVNDDRSGRTTHSRLRAGIRYRISAALRN